MSHVQFGYCLPIFANPTAGLFRTPNYDHLDGPTTLALGAYADELGFDSLWVADHLMLGRDEAILEGWTVLSALAGATRLAKLGMIHQAHYFRHPAMAAKMAATLDQISSGRLIMFYDFGRQQRESLAYGFPYPEPIDQRVDETIDGIKLVLDLWQSTAPLTTTRGSFQVTNATCTPGPKQTPHPPIWFGEMETGLLDACAQFGQGWNTTPVSLDTLESRLSELDAACKRAGRDRSDIEISVEMQILVAPDAELRGKVQQMLEKAPDQENINPDLRAYAAGEIDSPPASFTDGTFFGNPDQVSAQIDAYTAAGTDHFLFWFLDAPERGGMELFASEVAPRYRNS